MILGFAQVRTRDVVRSAPALLRAQLWCLGVLGCLILASVRVYARGGGVADVPITAWWPLVLALLSWAVAIGMALNQLSDMKKRQGEEKEAREKLEARLTAFEGTVVRKDKLDDKLETIAAQITSLHELLKRSDREWRESFHGVKE